MNGRGTRWTESSHRLKIPVAGVDLDGFLSRPPGATALVLLVEVSDDEGGVQRHDQMARALQAAGFGTLQLALLTPGERAKDRHSGYWRFEIDLLARRLREAIGWLDGEEASLGLVFGCVATNTGTAAVLEVAAQLPDRIKGVVSYSGRPDFVGDALGRLTAPVLLIVGESDQGILALNESAFERIGATKEPTIVHHAGHVFTQPETWDRVIALTMAWFQAHLPKPRLDRTKD